MTAINVIQTHDDIRFYSDGLFIDDGRVVDVAPKVFALPLARSAVGISGPGSLYTLVPQMLARCWSVDQVVADLKALLPTILRDVEKVDGRGRAFSISIGGFSGRGERQLWVFDGRISAAGEFHTTRCDADCFRYSPSLSRDVISAAMGESAVREFEVGLNDALAIANPRRHGLVALDTQRRTPASNPELNGGAPTYCVGGFYQETIVTFDSVTSSILRRFDNELAVPDMSAAIPGLFDGYMAADGINAGSSSNYTRTSTSAASSYVATSPATSTHGTFGLSTTNQAGIGGGGADNYGGFKFTAPATATISSIRFNVATVTNGGSATARLYTNNAGSPGTQVGVDSSIVAISSTGDVTISFPTPPSMTNATDYWIVLVPSGGLNINLSTAADTVGYGSGRNSVITSITDSLGSGREFKIEISYSTGVNNMTLVTTAQTLDANASGGRILLLAEPIDAITLNTDLVAEITCDGGANWTTTTMSLVGSGQGGRKIYESAEAACTSGTSFAARVTTANNKNVRLYGLALKVS